MPNFLDMPRMRELVGSLARHFSFKAREFGIEVGPRFANVEYVHGLGELGFNRMSVSIQDFDPAVRQAANRIQSVAQTCEVIEAARSSGFASVSVGLIYGLSRQTPEGFERTLAEVIALGPGRVAVYGACRFRHIHRVVLALMVGIVFLAKTMFYL